MRNPLRIVVVLALLAGCRFSFPRQLAAGEVRATVGVAGAHGFAPVAGASMRLVGTRLVARSDAKGAADLRGVPASTYDVELVATIGGAVERALVRGVVVPAATDGVDLGAVTLERTGSITGSVVHNGEATVGALVTALGVGPATTDEDGHFVLDGLAPGSYALFAAVGAHAYGSVPAKVTAQTEASVTIDVDKIPEAAPGSVSGHALQEGSGDWANIDVTLRPVAGGEPLTTQTDADGAFELDAPGGTYTVVAHRDGASDVRLEGVVVDGATKLPLLVLGDASATDDLDDDGHPDPATIRIDPPDAPVVAGEPATLTLSLVDAKGAAVVGYAGTLALTSDDAADSNLGEVTFAPADGGVEPATVTFAHPGVWHVVASDPANAALHSDAVAVPVSAAVSVSVVGVGGGRVAGGAIDCRDGSGACTTTLAPGATLELTATPNAGYAFGGWRGACSGRGACTVDATAAADVVAGFSAVYFWPSTGGLHAASLDGANDTTLNAGPGSLPSFGYFGVSPDGLALAYLDADDANLDFLDLATNTATRLTHYTQGERPGLRPPPAVSPDDRAVAFVSSAPTDGSDGAPGGWNLWVARVGSPPVALTTDGALSFIAAYAWSPDGTKVAFVSSTALATDAQGSYANVWVAAVDGSGLARLTDFTPATVAGDPGVQGVSWSADGGRVAFVSSLAPGASRTGDATLSVTNVWTVDAATKALFCVTNYPDERFLSAPLYSPASNDVVFSGAGLFAIADDGTNERALTANGHDAWFLGDGATLLYEWDVGTGMNVWRVPLDGSGAAAQVTNATGGGDFSPYDPQD